MKKAIYYLLCLLMILLFTSCSKLQSIHMSDQKCQCNKLPISELQLIIGEKISRDDLFEWIYTIYQVTKNDVKIEEYSQDELLFSWVSHGARYRVHTTGAELVTGWADDIQGPVPSAGCLVQCYGPPDWYQAEIIEHEGSEFIFSIFYSNLGILSSGITRFHINQDLPTSITDRYPMDYFLLKTPGEIEQTLSPVDVEKFKPWPGSWEEIIIDNRVGKFEYNQN